MKKVLAVVVMLAVLASSSSAEVIGTLVRSNTGTHEATQSGESFAASDGFMKSMLSQVLDAHINPAEASIKFYDSVAMMQLALERGDIYAIASPEAVGEYILRHNPEYTLRGFIIGRSGIAIAFGFLEDKKELCAKFSKVVEDMEAEGKIGILARDFVTGPVAISGNFPAVSFEEFDDAETLTAAVTGDMPPIDYVGADGEPAGFNVAMLAEIGRRLHVNIKLVVVDTASRAAALKSGRADIVFWFQVFEGYDVQPDVPEGVITSTPYYGCNKSVLIGKK